MAGPFKSMRGGNAGGGKKDQQFNPRQMRSLVECWEYFKGQVMPGEQDAEAMRRARMVFYAGAAFVMDQNMAVGEPNVTEDAGAAHLESISRELNEFAAELSIDVAGEMLLRLAPPASNRRH